MYQTGRTSATSMCSVSQSLTAYLCQEVVCCCLEVPGLWLLCCLDSWGHVLSHLARIQPFGLAAGLSEPSGARSPSGYTVWFLVVLHAPCIIGGGCMVHASCSLHGALLPAAQHDSCVVCITGHFNRQKLCCQCAAHVTLQCPTDTRVYLFCYPLACLLAWE